MPKKPTNIRLSEDAKRILSILAQKFGISQTAVIEDEYRHMFEQQNGLCAICGRPELKKRTLSVDHDHQTRKIRGLLCGTCNAGLGQFGDNSDYLLKAIEYLQRTS